MLPPDPKDASNLLQRAGFTLLTVDVEDITISYPSMWEMIEDLRDMGESGAVLGRMPYVKRDILIAAEAIYKGESSVCYGCRLIVDTVDKLRCNRVAWTRGWNRSRYVSSDLPRKWTCPVHKPLQLIPPARVQIGWKPSESTPKALARGSGKTNLKDVL